MNWTTGNNSPNIYICLSNGTTMEWLICGFVYGLNSKPCEMMIRCSDGPLLVLLMVFAWKCGDDHWLSHWMVGLGYIVYPISGSTHVNGTIAPPKTSWNPQFTGFGRPHVNLRWQISECWWYIPSYPFISYILKWCSHHTGTIST
jgi:hypothetical protein